MFTKQDKAQLRKAKAGIKAIESLHKRHPRTDGTVAFSVAEIASWLAWIEAQGRDSDSALPGQIALFEEAR